MSSKAINREIDGIVVSVYLALVVIGWFMIGATNTSILETETYTIQDLLFTKDSIWVAISVALFFACLIIDANIWNSFSWIIYAFGIILLLGVLLFGEEIKGAKSWYDIMGYSFQPSEFAKFSTALGLASFLSLRTTQLSNWQHQLIILGVILSPVVLILLQPDAGSASVFISFLLVLYRAGARSLYYIAGFFLFLVLVFSLMYEPYYITIILLLLGILGLALEHKRPIILISVSALLSLFAAVFVTNGYHTITLLILAAAFIGSAIYTGFRFKWNNVILILVALGLGLSLSFSSSWAYKNILKPHQQDRINVWLNPEKCDPQGSLYNVNQSKIAIGSGGLYGKGFLQGEMTKLNYVPEQSTDFIVSTLGEEQGFVGIVGLLILISILIIRLSIIAERANNTFVCYFAYAIMGLLFFQSFINIGMAMGFMPVIGIPLPFISKGGSALVSFSIMLGVITKLDMQRRRV